ncbi:MAG: insulinase family protein, partial [Lactobacillus sp.]|nr:insulinase family protein [Lactobacillus sp.]
MKADITTLKNGLRIISQTRKDIETASVGIWVKTGSAYEKESMNGISHFLEHMVFKGTKKRDSFAISEDLEKVGGHLNAYTSREFTSFYAKVLKNDCELAVDVLSDLVMNPIFPAEELIKEREVVVQEIKQSIDTPDDIIFDHLQETAFANQSLGRAILGPQEKVRAFDAKGLRKYMKSNYAAANTVVCAVGNIKHKDLVKMVEQRMGHMQTETSFKPQKQKYIGGCFSEKRSVEQVQVTIGFEGINYYDELYYANLLLSSIFGGGMSSRLFKEVREKKGLVYSIYSFL